jgi:hypothetical protein
MCVWNKYGGAAVCGEVAGINVARRFDRCLDTNYMEVALRQLYSNRCAESNTVASGLAEAEAILFSKKKRRNRSGRLKAGF